MSSKEWINHVKNYAQKHGVTYKEALKEAGSSYKRNQNKNFDIRKVQSMERTAKLTEYDLRYAIKQLREKEAELKYLIKYGDKVDMARARKELDKLDIQKKKIKESVDKNNSLYDSINNMRSSQYICNDSEEEEDEEEDNEYIIGEDDSSTLEVLSSDEEDEENDCENEDEYDY